MGDELKNKEVSKTNKNTDKPKVKSKPGLGFWLLVLISLLAIGLSGTVYLQLDKFKTSSNEEASRIKQIAAERSGLELKLTETNQENQQLANQLAELQQQQAELSASLSSVLQQQSMGNDDWALAEIEHLLIIATHRLQLERDISMTLAAMQAADDRLRDNDDPRLLAIRQQLMADMNALKAVEAVDISGLVLFLSDLVGRVTDLPLNQVEVMADVEQDSAVEEQSSNWQKLKTSVWQELKGLVRISRQGEESPVMLLPEQQYFLYQNLRLQLESARYAVLRRDTDNLQVSVDILSTWLGDYFDTSDSAVINILESLSQMATLELNPSLPDISSSLETLRAHMKAQEGPARVIQEQAPGLEQ
jgi:uroporphyrin-III C-methyltransferase